MRALSVQHVPGKIILIGEYAVLHGQPAIATCIPPQLTLTAALGPSGFGSHPGDTRLHVALATAAAFFDLDPSCIQIRTRSQLPIGAGLGSSAALSVALVRSLADLCMVRRERTELLQMATEVEHAFHNRSSGLDVQAVAGNGGIWFEPGPEPLVSQLTVHKSLDLIVAMSGQQRSTATWVNALTSPHAKHGSTAVSMEQLGKLTRAARTALASGDTAALGQIMNLAHTELSALGASTPTLDRMTTLARHAGALGAKLTGAGHGGTVIALAPTRARHVLTALRAAGFEAFITQVASRAAAMK